MKMTLDNDTGTPFSRQDHQAAYIFRPSGQSQVQGQGQPLAERPSKRRRTSAKSAPPQKAVPERDGDGDQADSNRPSSLFVPLLNGLESAECVRLRERLFEESWGRSETRVQTILRDANSATLDQVSQFVRTERQLQEKIASAFIITGANIASQDLLFGQLAERLHTGTRSRFVRLRSSEAANVKAALKKIIQDATTSGDSSDAYNDEDIEVSTGLDDRKYLNYDLESLAVYVKAHSCERVCVAFQDSEGFDSTLLSDLVVLFSSWMPRIPFTLLFGVATSVDLLQARLLKSACQLLYGAQFDVVQTNAILERVFKPAVAGSDVVLRLGPSLLQSLVDRQHDHVAGIHSFLSSLKYAYMCHFYANPLSIFAAGGHHGLERQVIQPEHLEAIRTLPSFRRAVEHAVEGGQLETARSLLDDDDYLGEKILEIAKKREEWTAEALQAMALLQATGVNQDPFPQMYMMALSEGINLSPGEDGRDDITIPDHHVVQAVKRMPPAELIDMVTRVSKTMQNGDPAVGLAGWNVKTKTDEGGEEDMARVFETLAAETQTLAGRAQKEGKQLKSAYSGQSRVVRTTVVAQKVQLSRDSAALSDEDRAFTRVVDRTVALLAEAVRCAPAEEVFLHETWLYDSRMPYRDVFVPRPRVVFERSLTRPHDYLACVCCRVEEDGDGAGEGVGGGIAATMPVTSLLYHLYLETPGLINVADLWAAFYALVGEEPEGEGEVAGEGGREERQTGYDERTALALFYRGLAELKALGFVKHSRRKVDHVAKVKWL